MVTAWQETKKLSQDKIWMDNVREDLKEKRIENYQDWEATKNKREVWSSLVRASSSATLTEERREEDVFFFTYVTAILTIANTQVLCSYV